jgi:DNA polymerase III, delta subunit
MSSHSIDHYRDTILSGKLPITPVLMSSDDILSILSSTTGFHLTDFEDIRDMNITSVSLYDIPEDKKELDIATIRSMIRDISVKPYADSHISVVRHFDTATISAQNALLKLLEDCPEYAIIILEVQNPRSLLDTIASRTIDLTSSHTGGILSDELSRIVTHYQSGNSREILSILHGLKCTAPEASLLIQYIIPYITDPETLDQALECIDILENTHENPRNVLDLFFI